MSALVRIKRSEVAGNPNVLAAGELAYSGLADNGANGGDRLYIGMGTETAGNAVNHVVIGGKYFTDQIVAATSTASTDTLVKRDASGNIEVNTVTGNLAGTAATATALATPRDLVITGDAAATLIGFNGTENVSASITLNTVNASIGTYGSGTAIPVITVNEKGLITGVSTVSTSGVLDVAGNTGSDSVALGSDTLSVLGGTGVSTSVANNTITIAVGQSVGTTDSVTFNSVAVNGTLTSDDITSANITVSGNATITGNLTVQGTTTTVNSTAVAISDVNLTLAKDATNIAQANGAGITVSGADATFTYTSVNDRWNLNKDLTVPTIYGSLNGNASTATKLETASNLSLTGDATADLLGFTGEADISAVITLANVNSNVGSFGSGTTVPTFTVNSKGLVTGVTEAGIPTATTTVLGLSKFDANSFTVTGGLVSLAVIDGGTY